MWRNDIMIEKFPAWETMTEFNRLVCVSFLANSLDDKWLTDSSAAVRKLLTAAQGHIDITNVDTAIDVNRMVWGAIWCEYGFPTIDIDDKQTAAFMATRVNDDTVSTLKPPWRAFAIRLGNMSLEMTIPKTGEKVEVKIIRVLRKDDYWTIALEPEDPDYNGLVIMCNRNNICDEEADIIGTEAKRLLLVIRRLTIATCIYLSDNALRQRAYQGKSCKVAKKLNNNALKFNRFAIRNSVKIDAREVIRDYLKHGGGYPTVKTLVRGHYRNQACGTGHKDRKYIWIEPFWRGPEDGPISMRIKK